MNMYRYRLRRKEERDKWRDREGVGKKEMRENEEEIS